MKELKEINKDPDLTKKGVENGKLISTYYTRIQELKDYEVTELTNTVVNIFKDYIIDYFNKENDIITLKGAKVGWENDLFRHQIEINEVFKKLGLVDEIKSHLFDIIYYGQYCIKIDYNKEFRNFVKYNLQNPYNVVSVIKGEKIDHHLVLSREERTLKENSNSIIRFGKTDICFINNITTQDKEDTILKSEDFVASMPLYYNLINKIKEYFQKDQVISLLSIKDLVQPLLLLVQVNKSTSADEATRLALNIENLMNKYCVGSLIDKYPVISSISGIKFSINDLVDFLENNIRVLPDYASALGDMNSIDLTKITNKISEIRNDQEMVKEQILTHLGIPRALLAGEVSKWEALKGNNRLQSKVNNYISNINDSLIYAASVFYYHMTGKEINIEDIECNLFTNDIKEKVD